jgi:hypothetical protein
VALQVVFARWLDWRTDAHFIRCCWLDPHRVTKGERRLGSALGIAFAGLCALSVRRAAMPRLLSVDKPQEGRLLLIGQSHRRYEPSTNVRELVTSRRGDLAILFRIADSDTARRLSAADIK